MKYGLSFLPDASANEIAATLYYENALSLSAMADQSGLSTIKMTEHYLHNYGGYCPSPLMFFSALSALTTQIRLMTGGILPTFHHQVSLASEIAMLDVLSRGRLDLGFARAYLPYEFEAFGIPLSESRTRFVETINKLKTSWAITDKPLRILPELVQQPHPPIWVAAVNSRQSFSWIGEQGYGLLMTPSLRGLSDTLEKIEIYLTAFTPTPFRSHPEIALSLPLYLAESNLIAEREADSYLLRYYSVWAHACESWNGMTSADYPGYGNMASFIREQTLISTIERFGAVIGSPQNAIHRIESILQSLPINQILWQIDFGAQDFSTMSRTLSLFINEVLPWIG